MSDDNKDDEGPEPDQGDDELFVTLAPVHLQANCNRVDHKQDHNDQPVDAEDGGGEVVQFFKVGVVVVD